MSLILPGATSGSITIDAPAVAGTNTLTLPAQTGTLNVAGPAFSAYQSSSQSISSGSWTKVQFQTKEFDTATCFDATTNYRFTPNVAGYYQINTSVTGGSITALYFGVQIYKNGSGFKYGTFYSATTINPTSVASALIYMNGSTDYLEVYLITGTSNSLSAGAATTYFQGSLVRTA